mgnify:FL=1|tara:strand:- start:269 stop:463 length:195 start_codon:yes stop_codon:yes gene_type:complete
MYVLFVIFTIAALFAFIVWLALIEDKIEEVAEKAADDACRDMDERCQNIKWRYRSLKSKLETTI